MLVVIYSANGDFLLLERADKQGFWQSVTGSVDSLAEPLLHTAQRELFEETGFVAQACQDQTVQSASRSNLLEPFVLRAWPHCVQYDIMPHWRHRYPNGVTHNTEHWFAVCVPQGQEPTLAEREHVDSVWLPAQQAAARCFSPSNAQAVLSLAEVLRGGGFSCV